MIEALTTVGTLLLKHSDLIELLVEVIDSGAEPDVVKKALRKLKIATSDELFKEELGID